MIAVFRSPDPTNPLGIMGDYESNDDPGVALFITGAQEDYVQAQIQNTVSSTSPLRALTNGESNFNLFGISAPAVGGATSFTASGSSTQATSYTRAFTTSGNLLLGGLPNSGFQTPIDLAFAGVWNRAISASEISAMIAWAVAHMWNYGELLEPAA